ncbi:MAG: hypothetical protein ABSC89_08075 [Verrucomicrobiota bacterium]|jgi:hypothetical protein
MNSQRLQFLKLRNLPARLTSEEAAWLSPVLDEGQVTTVLLKRAPEEFQHRVRGAFADWLDRHLQNAERPACVADFLTNGWPLEKGGITRMHYYQAFGLFFREKSGKSGI